MSESPKEFLSQAHSTTISELELRIQLIEKQFKHAIWVISIAIAVLSAIGIGKLSDIETNAREKIDSAVNKSTEFFDNIVSAQARINAFQWNSAAAYLEQAMTFRPDDEFIFTNLLMCYANAADIDAGLKLLEDAERTRLLRKYTGFWTHLNTARFYMIAGVIDSKYIKSAEHYFNRAEHAAMRMKGGEVVYILYSLGIYQLILGNDEIASDIYKQLFELDPMTEKWLDVDRMEPWLLILTQIRPTLLKDIESLFAAARNNS